MKRYAKGVLILIVLLYALTACSYRQEPKGWVSVEKAPMRVIVVDNEHDITPEVIHRLVDQVKSVPYHDYKFNDGVSIGVDYKSSIKHEVIDTKSMNLNNLRLIQD